MTTYLILQQLNTFDVGVTISNFYQFRPVLRPRARFPLFNVMSVLFLTNNFYIGFSIFTFAGLLSKTVHVNWWTKIKSNFKLIIQPTDGIELVVHIKKRKIDAIHIAHMWIYHMCKMLNEITKTIHRIHTAQHIEYIGKFKAHTSLWEEISIFFR